MKNSENIYLSNNPPILSHSKHCLLLMKEAIPDVPILFLNFSYKRRALYSFTNTINL